MMRANQPLLYELRRPGFRTAFLAGRFFATGFFGAVFLPFDGFFTLVRWAAATESASVRPPLLGRGRALLVAQHQHGAFALQQLAHAAGREESAGRR